MPTLANLHILALGFLRTGSGSAFVTAPLCHGGDRTVIGLAHEDLPTCGGPSLWARRDDVENALVRRVIQTPSPIIHDRTRTGARPGGLYKTLTRSVKTS